MATATLVATAVVALDSQRTPADIEPHGAAWTPPREPIPVRRSRKELSEPLSIATKFVQTAVARRQVASSWPLASPSLKVGFTRRQWARGDIPVVPYPVDVTRWRLDYSYANELAFQVALFPKPSSRLRPTVFDVQLRRYGSGKDRRWLVESITPSVQRLAAPEFGIPQRPAGLPNLGGGLGTGEPRLSAAWLALPGAIMSLILLVPLSLFVAHVLRTRRAEREFARHRLERSRGRPQSTS